MPSLLHEALVMLFRNRPTLAPELVREVLHQPLPDHDEVQVEDANLSQITPTEYHADLVVLLRSRVPVFGIVLEVQLGRDEDKSYSWPLYAAALRGRLRCPTCVLVVTPDEAVAQWARRPIETGQPGSPFVPLVLGPEAVPRVTDIEVARRAPELAVLSAQAHGRDEDAMDVVLAALAAADGLRGERRVLYYEFVLLTIGETMRRRLELMLPGFTFQSEFAKELLAKGEAKGRAEGKQEDILAVLEERFGAVPDALGQAVRALNDPGVLSDLHREAIRASSLEAFEAVLRERAPG